MRELVQIIEKEDTFYLYIFSKEKKGKYRVTHVNKRYKKQ